jgi:hypothetical protein
MHKITHIVKIFLLVGYLTMMLAVARIIGRRSSSAGREPVLVLLDIP